MVKNTTVDKTIDETSSTTNAWTKEQAETFIKEKGGVSPAIRFLLNDLKEKVSKEKLRGTVAKLLHKRYQHVRNVERTPLKKG